MNQMLRGENLTIFGSGEQARRRRPSPRSAEYRELNTQNLCTLCSSVQHTRRRPLRIASGGERRAGAASRVRGALCAPRIFI